MKSALLVLVFCAGVVCGQHPSAAEFNLFCRILAEANNMMYGPDYVYDENADKEIIKEMTVLYNATTGDMDDFRKTLWDTKDFFEEHPPPTHSESRKRAHREIGNLIKEGERKIEENKKIAEKVNEEINKAKLSVAQGIFGEHVTEVPKNDGNLSGILDNTRSIFNNEHSATTSCGNKGKAGKTLLNDFFCVCVGDGGPQSAGPCSPHILPSKSGNGRGGWKKIKLKNKEALEFKESFKHIEKVCTEELLGRLEKAKDMTALLAEYVNMIGMGGAKKNPDGKKIFGHSARDKGAGLNTVEECTGGEKAGSKGTGNEKGNEHICVDYNETLKDGKEIPWHTKFRNYTTFMKSAKNLEDQILKNRAALLLLKSQAWVAYGREKDDETSNLDDMNASDKKDTMAENKQSEPKNQGKEFIHVSSQSTQATRPSQDAPVRPEAPYYHLVSSTETTQREAQAPAAGGGEIAYIYISSTESSQATAKKPGEDGGWEPEITVISSESATQEVASPSKGPSQTQQDPPTQSAKRLREENKTGE